MSSVKWYFTQKSHSTNVPFGTYVSVLATSSHPAVDAADAALRSNDQRSASVHNSLATAIASHNLTINGNTRKEIQCSMHQTDI